MTDPIQERSSTSRAQAESVAPVAMFVGKDTSRPTSRVPSSTVETATYHQRSTVSDGDTSLQSFYEEHDNIEAGHYDRPKGSPPSDHSDPSDPSSTSSEGSRVSKDSSTSRTARGQSPSHHGIGSQYVGQPGVIAEPGPVSKSLKGLETRKRFRGKDPTQYPSTNNLELTQIGGEVGPVTGHGSSDQQSSNESEQPSHAIGASSHSIRRRKKPAVHQVLAQMTYQPPHSRYVTRKREGHSVAVHGTDRHPEESYEH